MDSMLRLVTYLYGGATVARTVVAIALILIGGSDRIGDRFRLNAYGTDVSNPKS